MQRASDTDANVFAFQIIYANVNDIFNGILTCTYVYS